jgi:hypothetical protein
MHHAIGFNYAACIQLKKNPTIAGSREKNR